MTGHTPTAAEVGELRAAVLYSYEAGEPNLAAITSDWVRGIVSQPDGGLVDLIDALAARVTPRRTAVADLAALTELLAQHPWYLTGRGKAVCLGCLDDNRQLREFIDYAEFSAHLTELAAADFLIVPRSSILGTEYAVRRTPPGSCSWEYPATDRADAINQVAEAVRRGVTDHLEAVERPDLPWSPTQPSDEGTPR